MKVSIIIITNQKNKSILDVCVNSALDNADEVIIVGDISNLTYSKVKYIEAKKYSDVGNLGKLRNIGEEASSGEIIVNCDDDIIFTLGFKNKTIKYFTNNPNIQSCNTKVLGNYGNRYWDRVVHKKQKSILVEYNSHYDPDLYYSGAFLIRRKNFSIKYKFKENLGFYEGEDVIYSNYIKSQGYKINIDTNNVVIHWDPNYVSVKNDLGNEIHLVRLDQQPEDFDTKYFQTPSKTTRRLKNLAHSTFKYYNK